MAKYNLLEHYGFSANGARKPSSLGSETETGGMNLNVQNKQGSRKNTNLAPGGVQPMTDNEGIDWLNMGRWGESLKEAITDNPLIGAMFGSSGDKDESDNPEMPVIEPDGTRTTSRRVVSVGIGDPDAPVTIENALDKLGLQGALDAGYKLEDLIKITKKQLGRGE
jgi:hypothetical protein